MITQTQKNPQTHGRDPAGPSLTCATTLTETGRNGRTPPLYGLTASLSPAV